MCLTLGGCGYLLIFWSLLMAIGVISVQEYGEFDGYAESGGK